MDVKNQGRSPNVNQTNDKISFFRKAGSIFGIQFPKTKPGLPLGLEDAFLLQSRVSISILGTLTYMLKTHMLNVCNAYELDTSKTFTFANQSQAPVIQSLSVTGFSSFQTLSRIFKFRLVVVGVQKSGVMYLMQTLTMNV